MLPESLSSELMTLIKATVAKRSGLKNSCRNQENEHIYIFVSLICWADQVAVSLLRADF